MKRIKNAWSTVCLFLHTGYVIYHANKIDSLREKPGHCTKCGGRKNKHYPFCSVWTGEER